LMLLDFLMIFFFFFFDVLTLGSVCLFSILMFAVFGTVFRSAFIYFFLMVYVGFVLGVELLIS
jgi:hypothetical protein